MNRFERSVEKTLDKTNPVSTSSGHENSGQYLFSSRLQNDIRHAKILGNNLQGVISQGQIQEGYLQTAIGKYQRMSVLATESSNPMLNGIERTNMQTEFDLLREDVHKLRQESFNGHKLLTDEEQQEANLPNETFTLLNVDLPTFMDSSALSVESVDKAASAISTLEGTLQSLSAQRANIGSNRAQAEIAMERLNRKVAAAEFSFARMSDEEMIKDLTTVARHKLTSDASLALLSQARGINRNLTETLL
jgi:flagellin-like hook-associated protein FlgL